MQADQEPTSTEVSVNVFDGDNPGFIHTWNDSFTYFAGSNAGAAQSFGLSTLEILNLLGRYEQQILQKYRDNRNATIQSQLKQLKITVALCRRTLMDADQGLYSEAKMKKLLNEFGHIPLILSQISGAAEHNTAATKVSEHDLSWYFKYVYGSKQQAHDYLVKQELMQCVGGFRKQLVKTRYSIPTTDAAFYCLNDLVMQLDTDVIKVNQKSLPDSETFDRCETFKDKVHRLTCEIPASDDFRELREGILAALNQKGPAYSTQEYTSHLIYTCVKDFMRKLGLDDKVQDLELEPDDFDKIKFVLPLVEYITSAHNPFACNGLFGAMLASPFHSEALDAYRKHESKLFFEKAYQLEVKPFSGVMFDEDQFNDLIFGNEKYKASQKAHGGLFGSITSTLAGLLTQGDANAGRNTDLSRQAATQRSVPEQYLLLEAPSATQNLNNNNNK